MIPTKETAVREMTVEELIEKNKKYLGFIEDRYKEMQKRCEKLNERIEHIELNSYNEGFADGYKEGIAKGEQNMQEKANKIIEFYRDNNNDINVLQTVFNNLTFAQIFEYIDTAYRKINEYEKKKEQEEKEIHVGDVVVDKIGKKYIVRVLEDDLIYVWASNGESYVFEYSDVSKTGKHYPLEEILKELE